jgi:hypothetical protein
VAACHWHRADSRGRARPGWRRWHLRLPPAYLPMAAARRGPVFRGAAALWHPTEPRPGGRPASPAGPRPPSRRAQGHRAGAFLAGPQVRSTSVGVKGEGHGRRPPPGVPRCQLVPQWQRATASASTTSTGILGPSPGGSGGSIRVRVDSTPAPGPGGVPASPRPSRHARPVLLTLADGPGASILVQVDGASGFGS